MSEHEKEILEQLKMLGVERDKIYFFDQYMSEKLHGKIHLYIGGGHCCGKRILLLTNDLDYHGSAVALVNAAEALREKKYDVLIVAAKGNKGFIRETVDRGNNVMICPALPIINKEEWFWIEAYDVVLVNTFLMIQAAFEIGKQKPVLWWMHEAKDTYKSMQHRYTSCLEVPTPHYLHAFSVSNLARKNFESFCSIPIEGILPYGIADECAAIYQKASSKFIFAVIFMC